ncbi:hypothetical protein [Zunongwangia profunda]|uniref:hypothetical protein n=1 Tax=Zunongwangia profunda TaxID=398743 RepID=UPI000C8AC8F0|nr:hypothetical protein [Zunongwangia profunda]MAG87260.1 hypothetical protein [Flavobacteriaceae bacterium]|tara:strand:+ start:1775 stop:1981 length:207 start_codon:yes stop_codon:yes gene_type:complete
MKAEFTENHKTLLKGHLFSIARKHNCSRMYVKMILDGDREINTDLAKSVYDSLKNLAEFLKPEDIKIQ